MDQQPDRAHGNHGHVDGYQSASEHSGQRSRRPAQLRLPARRQYRAGDPTGGCGRIPLRSERDRPGATPGEASNPRIQSCVAALGAFLLLWPRDQRGTRPAAPLPPIRTARPPPPPYHRPRCMRAQTPSRAAHGGGSSGSAPARAPAAPHIRAPGGGTARIQSCTAPHPLRHHGCRGGLLPRRSSAAAGASPQQWILGGSQAKVRPPPCRMTAAARRRFGSLRRTGCPNRGRQPCERHRTARARRRAAGPCCGSDPRPAPRRCPTPWHPPRRCRRPAGRKCDPASPLPSPPGDWLRWPRQCRAAKHGP